MSAPEFNTGAATATVRTLCVPTDFTLSSEKTLGRCAEIWPMPKIFVLMPNYAAFRRMFACTSAARSGNVVSGAHGHGFASRQDRAQPLVHLSLRRSPR